MSDVLHVLILEDREADAELMLHALRKAGFEPDWQRVESEASYLAALETNPDLILADWSLPQFSGQRALKLIRDLNLEIPFIIVSGSIGEDVAVQAMRDGATDYLLKDRLARLGESVRRALEDYSLKKDRKKAENALRESENELRALFASMHDIVMAIDRTGVYRKFAPTNPELYARPPEELLGKNLHDVFPKKQAESLIDCIQQVLLTKQNIQVEYDLPIGDRIVTFDTAIAPLDENATLWVARDITERKRAEENIRGLNAELEQRVMERTSELRDIQEQLVKKEKLATLGLLAGSVGHELRNPLGVIKTSIYYLDLIQPKAEEKVKQYHSIIQQEVANANKIITDLLDFSRTVTPDREHVSVQQLVRDTLERFPVPQTVEVSLNLPDNLPKVFVDARQITQVLGNISTNAWQAMSNSGKLTISAKLENLNSNRGRKNKMVSISITDTGTGISNEVMKKIFEPLFSTKIEGVGLGLAVSKKMAEVNDGWIAVISKLGKGSTFTLFLPLAE